MKAVEIEGLNRARNGENVKVLLRCGISEALTKNIENTNANTEDAGRSIEWLSHDRHGLLLLPSIISVAVRNLFPRW